MPFIRKDDLQRLLYEERQKAIKECKADLAWAISQPVETAWMSMIDMVELLYKAHKERNG